MTLRTSSAERFAKQGFRFIHQADGPLGSLFRDKCSAARTMPSRTQMYQKYVPEVYEHDLETIKEAVKNRPISLTIDETPELRGRPAVAVLVTFYDDDVPGHRTLTADLQVLQQCNAVSLGMLIQEVLKKTAKSLSDVSVLCSDSASYMQKLHRDMQQSHTEFRVLHFKDPCHILNNILEEELKMDCFKGARYFVVHFPALLKSSRELRRSFPSLRVTSAGGFSRSVAVMEAAQVLAPLLLFVGNAVCGILAHWLHLRLDAKQRHPRSSSEGSPLGSVSGSYYGSTANGNNPMPQPRSPDLFVAPVVQGSLILLGSVSLAYYLRSNSLGATADFTWKAFLTTAIQSYLVAYAVSLVLYASAGRGTLMLWGSVFYAIVPALGCIVGLAARSKMNDVAAGAMDALCGGAVLFVTCFEVLQRFPDEGFFDALWCYQILAHQICDRALYASVVERPGFSLTAHRFFPDTSQWLRRHRAGWAPEKRAQR
ncbi:hypothetical protein HPB47_018987 [Ixodes persulcatus]|uniref:Uncharacterized protein n=1 Tax=Ixodes persulcatus TaxID=34615 RepID=A0AC60QK72_IXOPE|nr:hypothetical protein HPB47_018987 [Ixodes persulcatus]